MLDKKIKKAQSLQSKELTFYWEKQKQLENWATTILFVLYKSLFVILEWLSTGSDFSHREHLAMTGDILGCYWKECYWHLVDRGQGWC